MRKNISTSSLSTYKQRIREFFKWFYKIDERGKNPKIVDWIKISVIPPKEISREQLLSWQDIREVLIPNCNNFRDKAFISLLRETGARINEILSLNISDVRFEDNKAFVRMRNSKMKHGLKRYREMLLIDSFYFLENWIRNHPLKNKEAPLFTGKNNNRMKYCGVSKLMERVRKKIKISNPIWNKPLNPHHFRHSQISDMSKILSDAELRIFGGWTKNSPMVGRYVHVTSDDVNEKRLQLLGRSKPKEIINIKENLQHCQRCNSFVDLNKFKFCGKCGMALNVGEEIKASIKLQDLENKFNTLFKKFKKIEEEKLLKEIEHKNDKN